MTSKQEQLNTPTPIYHSGPVLNEIEQKWHRVLATTTFVDPEMQDFIAVDVGKLLAIAKAAYSLTHATNAESYRQASQNLQAMTR